MGNPPGDERSTFRTEMEKIAGPLKIVLVTPEAKSEACEEFMAIMEDILKANSNITLETYKEGSEDLPTFDPPVDLYPTILLLDHEGKEHGTRFIGAPSGRILHSFALSSQLITSGASGLEEPMALRVDALKENEIKVLLTPQAPNIEGTMDAMVRFAYANSKIRTSIIELIQFPEIAERYRVIDMPKTLSNEDLRYTGAFSLEDAIQILENRIGDPES